MSTGKRWKTRSIRHDRRYPSTVPWRPIRRHPSQAARTTWSRASTVTAAAGRASRRRGYRRTPSDPERSAPAAPSAARDPLLRTRWVSPTRWRAGRCLDPHAGPAHRGRPRPAAWAPRSPQAIVKSSGLDHAVPLHAAVPRVGVEPARSHRRVPHLLIGLCTTRSAA